MNDGIEFGSRVLTRLKRDTGEIRIGKRHYWARELAACAGQHVEVLFVHERQVSVRRWDADGWTFVCVAELIPDTGFDNPDAAEASVRQSHERGVRSQVVDRKLGGVGERVEHRAHANGGFRSPIGNGAFALILRMFNRRKRQRAVGSRHGEEVRQQELAAEHRPAPSSSRSVPHVRPCGISS